MKPDAATPHALEKPHALPGVEVLEQLDSTPEGLFTPWRRNGVMPHLSGRVRTIGRNTKLSIIMATGT
jgi:hypothetical protein